jgi:hypothetical protein
VLRKAHAIVQRVDREGSTVIDTATPRHNVRDGSFIEALILRCSNQFDQSVVEVSKVVTRYPGADAMPFP